ncbi:hypothetical protein C6N75_02280 [Streptomyces solincola]|uniref:Uncharacterized protein n=1 Tax=Streptomyces solincola TaxID=2100817 RepID=A0A2S9Q2A1_9ACTN|nr:hypothetical protein [Streptomyces solincola]PRH80747.1 hypothetical protein C6N75_02280 [Streptomyces solincola]
MAFHPGSVSGIPTDAKEVRRMTDAVVRQAGRRPSTTVYDAVLLAHELYHLLLITTDGGGAMTVALQADATTLDVTVHLDCTHDAPDLDDVTAAGAAVCWAIILRLTDAVTVTRLPTGAQRLRAQMTLQG